MLQMLLRTHVNVAPDTYLKLNLPPPLLGWRGDLGYKMGDSIPLFIVSYYIYNFPKFTNVDQPHTLFRNKRFGLNEMFQ